MQKIQDKMPANFGETKKFLWFKNQLINKITLFHFVKALASYCNLPPLST